MSEGDAFDKTSPAPRPARVGAVEDGEVLAGRYRLVRFVAAGGMGEVWEAEDLTLREHVALKTLRPEALDPESVERFRREVKLARRVSHRNVCRVFEFGEHVRPSGEKVSFLTMELLKGLPLQDLLRQRGRMGLSQALPLLEQMAAALGAAHAEGIVHRDFKSNNVFVEETGQGLRVVVTDFGIARAVDAESRLTASKAAMIGTPAYMAPEQVEGNEAGPAADVFALGVVAFEMLTGKLPFTGETAIAIAIKRLSAPPLKAQSLVPEVPVHVDGALAVALARAPADRFPSASAFVDALRSTRPLPRRRRSGWLQMAAVAGLSLAAGFTALWWWQRIPSGEKRLSIAVVPAAAEDVWFASAAQELVRHRWCVPGQTFRCEPDDPNVDVLLRLARTSRAVDLELSVARHGQHLRTVTRVSAPSVAQALDGLAPTLSAALGAQTPLPPTDAERAEARRYGTESIEAWRAYQKGDALVRNVMWEPGPSLEALEKAVALDPGWARAWTLLLNMNGLSGEKADAVLARARASVKENRDEAGDAAFAAVPLMRDNKHDEVIALLRPHFDKNPGDFLVGTMLVGVGFRSQRLDEVVSVARLLNRERPDLQFGADLAGVLLMTGRQTEVAPLASDWIRRAPDSEQALSLQMAMAVEAGDAPKATALVRDMLALFGDAPQRWLAVCDALIGTRQYTAAQQWADQLSILSGKSRAQGHYRQGLLALLGGRFAVAEQLLGVAEAENRPFGLESELTQTITALISVQLVLQEKEAARASLGRLVAAYREFGMEDRMAATTYELALASGGCPATEPLLASVPDGVLRQTLRRAVLRFGAAAGCFPCSEVLQAGSSASETSMRAQLEFATCAEKEGDLALAEQVFREVTILRASSLLASGTEASPYHMMIARFRRARVLEKLGRGSEAKAGYAEFVAGWAGAEAMIPEVKEAKAALVRLKTTP